MSTLSVLHGLLNNAGNIIVNKKTRKIKVDDLTISPLTPALWPDFENLFGPRGAYGGCWCMWWRVTRKEFESCQGEKNRRSFRKIVDSGKVTGLLGYINNQAVGWCSVAPREQFSSLERSHVLKRIDDKAVWSIVCFYIKKDHRGDGLTLKMIRGAIEYVRQRGGEIIEAYPTAVRSPNAPPVSIFMGIPEVYKQAGFREVARPSRSKRIMRLSV